MVKEICNLIHSYGLFHDQLGNTGKSRDMNFIGTLWTKFYNLESNYKKLTHKDHSPNKLLLKDKLLFLLILLTNIQTMILWIELSTKP